MKITVNSIEYDLDVDPETPLLWVLRDILGLTGTKFGCGISACGACTVHINGEAHRSCTLPIDYVDGPVTTIEGLSDDDTLHPVQAAWVETQVAQCGYCQSGQIMSAAALLSQTTHVSDDDIDQAMAGNLCRCGAYARIRKAIHVAAEKMRES